jgi:hypothetical protein
MKSAKKKSLIGWLVVDHDNYPYEDMGLMWCYTARKHAKGASKRSDEFVKKVRITFIKGEQI